MSRSGRYTVNPDEGARVEDRRPENRDLVNGPQQAANSLGNTPDYYGDRGMNGRENESLLMKPVTLSPSWEEQNKPEDELNFKTVVVTSEPKDRFNFVYIIMLIHGIGVLMPWNMFITAEKYFTDYKLATNTSGDTEYRDNFMSYLGIASQIPNVLLNFINLFVQCGGNPRTRIPGSIALIALIFILTTALAMIDSSDWPGYFFFITMISVVVMNMATGIYQNSVFGMAGPLPMKYTGAVVLGNNLSGTITSVINIIAITLAPDPQSSAIWYFIAALLVLLMCFDTYFALPILRFFRYHERRALQQRGASTTTKCCQFPPYGSIFKKVWVQCFNIWFIFTVTLTIFPAMQVKVVKLDQNFIINDFLRTDVSSAAIYLETPDLRKSIGEMDENFVVVNTYFTAVTCFLFFNAFAMIGNFLAGIIKFPGPRYLWIFTLLRGLLIPMILFCNYKPDVRTLPVFIANDYAYCAIGIFMALTSGYLSSLIMMYTPGLVEPHNAGIAGMMAAFFLVFGIFSGVNFSLVMAKLVEAF